MLVLTLKRIFDECWELGEGEEGEEAVLSDMVRGWIRAVEPCCRMYNG
jgi:hypothetical protein